MKPPEKMVRIVDRRRYSTATATLLAGDDYWDGRNWERGGRNTWLYRTPNGNYFYVVRTQWQGEQDTLQPVDLDEAIRMYEHDLSEHYELYRDAFPDVEVEDA